jgi:hypothetical protein
MRLVVRSLYQLNEETVVPLRVHEGDHVAAPAEARFLVDKGDAFFLEFGERSGQVVDLESDVMEPFTPPVDELGDGGFWTCRPEQLEVRVSHRDHRFFDPLVFDPLAVFDLGSPYLAVVGERRL